MKRQPYQVGEIEGTTRLAYQSRPPAVKPEESPGLRISFGKSVVIYGPQGCGKTRHARELAKYFGLQHWRDDWVAGDPIPLINHLLLTNEDPRAVQAAPGQQVPARMRGLATWRRVFSFDEAMTMAGLK